MSFYVLQEIFPMNDLKSEITQQFGINWTFFVAQVVSVMIVVGLFVLAARAILSRARGWEVPVWLLLSFFIPIVLPIIALIHFRESKAFLPNSPQTLL